VASLGLAVDGVLISLDPEIGGRIAQVEVDGHELLHGSAAGGGDPTPTGWGSFPMAPYAGRVRHGLIVVDGVEHHLQLRNGPHAMHGTVLDRPWTVTEHTASSCSMRAELGPDWPWDGWCEQHLDLSGERLALRLEVHSAGDAFPASAGWHPWFRTRLATGAELRIDIVAGAMAVRDGAGIPTGEWRRPSMRPWDDCLREVEWPVRLRWARATRAEIGVDVWAGTDHVVVYDQPEHAWCVEPQTAPPDALGSTADIVTPERPLVVTGEWRWIRPEAPYLSGE
jgi:aldose 1-epimerase